jgi:hypothetical protein
VLASLLDVAVAQVHRAHQHQRVEMRWCELEPLLGEAHGSGDVAALQLEAAFGADRGDRLRIELARALDHRQLLGSAIGATKEISEREMHAWVFRLERARLLQMLLGGFELAMRDQDAPERQLADRHGGAERHGLLRLVERRVNALTVEQRQREQRVGDRVFRIVRENAP